MASVPGRLHAFFRLSPAQRAEASCFGVLRGEIQGRFDVNYWRLTPFVNQRFEHPHYPVVTLGSALTLVQYGSSSRAKSEPPGVRIVRMNNLQDDGWDLSDLKYIELSRREINSYRLVPGDILFNRTNSKELVGKCAVFREAGDWVFASYLIRVRTDGTRLMPQFASDFLATRIGRLQIDRVSRQIIGMTNINAAEIRELRLPLPPPEDQAQLIAKMDAARAERQAKLLESVDLLDGLDTFLLETLGINPNPPQHAVFAVRRHDIYASRFDPDFHSARFQTIRAGIERGRYGAKTVDELCDAITTGFAAGKQDQAFDHATGLPHLRPLNLNIYAELSLEGTKFVPKNAVTATDLCIRGEVLFNNTNSTEMVGKSAVFNLDQPCACSNHMTRLKPRVGVNAEFLVGVFNALRRIGYLGLLSTNFNNQAGINTSTLRQLKLPCPTPTEQGEIALELRHRRKAAHRLQEEADTAWQTAKSWFEEQLLGTPES